MKNKKVAIIVAMLLIIICFLPTILLLQKKKSGQYEIICFGDSVMAGYYGDATIPACIENATGRKTLNAAFGGLSMSEPFDAPALGNTDIVFSMVDLSKALVARDFSLQIEATKKRLEWYTQEWYDVAKSLDTLDYDSVKYVIIEHGINDYLLGRQIEDSSDGYNVSTFAGALRTSIENVQKALPNATIILTTPTYLWLDYSDLDCTELDLGAGTLTEYVAKEKEIAAEYNLICVDNFYESGINRDNYLTYLYDGLHTLYEGNVLIADNIIRNVEGLRK